ncbi:MAG: hypothetical protein QW392_08075, partial [Candidatus Jordarchaeales archaeon]
ARVDQLAEAQRRTEERLEQLAARVDQLAEAQRRTEERLEQLAARVDQLAEAQRRTEERLEQLAARVDQLAEAQRRTEERLEQLASTVRETRDALSNLATQVGRLSEVVGFGLEDVARIMVAGWLDAYEGILVGEFERGFFVVDGKEVEFDLFARGRNSMGEDLFVVGECKSRIYERDVRAFVERVEAVKKKYPEVKVYAFMFGYVIHPSGDKVAEKHGVKLLAPYRIPVKQK